MKFSETEGTDISNKKQNSGKFIGLFLMMLIGGIQTTFANNLNLYTNQGEVIVITNFGGNENLFFNGVMADGVLEAIQTTLHSFNEKSNSDGTGGKSNSDGTGGDSNSDGTGGDSNSDGTGGDSNSDGTGGDSNSDGTGGKSNSDGTGAPNSLLTVVMDCDNKGNNHAYGIIETDKGTTTVEFSNVYMDGELMTCDGELNFADNS